MINVNFKRIKQVIAGILIINLWLCPVFFSYAGEIKEPEGLYSMGAVLMDADSGRILFDKGGDEILAMASTTKIMTCILALELGEPGQIVTFSQYAASMPDVQMNAKEGEQYYLTDLLYSTMLESHNDSAVAVAEAVGGSTEAFVMLMNRKAEAIGCENTYFVTPNGLDGENEGGAHCTTAKELAMILRYCIQISPAAEKFLEITAADTYEFQEIHGKRYVSCRNHNAFLNSYEGAFTGKTGFTGKAGYCYTGAVSRGERTLIISLLGAGWYPNKSYKWKDAKKLFDYGFENYHYVKVGKEKWELSDLNVSGGMKQKCSVTSDASTFMYLLGENEQVKCRISYGSEITAPVKEHTLVGNIIYEIQGKTIEQFHIYTAENIEKATMVNKVKEWLKTFYVNMLELRKMQQNT